MQRLRRRKTIPKHSRAGTIPTLETPGGCCPGPFPPPGNAHHADDLPFPLAGRWGKGRNIDAAHPFCHRFLSAPLPAPTHLFSPAHPPTQGWLTARGPWGWIPASARLLIRQAINMEPLPFSPLPPRSPTRPLEHRRWGCDVGNQLAGSSPAAGAGIPFGRSLVRHLAVSSGEKGCPSAKEPSLGWLHAPVSPPRSFTLSVATFLRGSMGSRKLWRWERAAATSAASPPRLESGAQQQ